jgi:oxygen-independent coproporphyrinogen III oxidase
MLITPNILAESPYQSYVYSYPHKTAYRPINPPIPLKSLWAEEDKSTLFLYMHIPFCEMRCGFCNLFTTVHPQKSLETAYLDTLEVQARRVRDALGTASFARMAIGGGTPTYLTPDELIRLFSIAVNIMGVDLQQTPISVETSPLTSQTERLQVLHDHM